MRTVGVISVARSDFGLFRPILQEAQKRPNLRLRCFVAGSHLSAAHGMTIKEIEAEEWPIAARIETVCSDSPRGIATSMAVALSGFGAAYDTLHPDALLVLGDRFETFCAVAAALPFRLPVFHLHGGEATEGLYDEAFRHAITKMAHIHLASSEWAAGRLRALGEEAWRIQVVGAPGLDGIAEFKPIPRAEATFLPSAGKFLLVVQHPETLSHKVAVGGLAISTALRRLGIPFLWVGPGADMGWWGMTAANADVPPNSRYTAHLPRPQFWTAMAYAEAMVGNSSAGILEAASFGLPVVNVGDRQKGRLAAENVLHVEPKAEAIASAIRVATHPDYGMKPVLVGMKNPYGDGHAASRICDILDQVPLNDTLLKKRVAI